MMAMALPDHKELSPSLLGFLDDRLASAASTDDRCCRRHYDVDHRCSSLSFSCSCDAARDLVEELSRECSELDAHLLKLHQNLAKLLISWISRSISAKTALQKFNHNLLSLKSIQQPTPTSPYGIGSTKIQKMLSEDLPQLAKELKRIENVRNYADATLQLEAKVGDLEDAIVSVVNQQTGNDCQSRQGKFFQAVRSMNDIEEILVNPVKFQPQWCLLMKSVDYRVEKILNLLRPQVLAQHRALLSSLGWPPKVLTSNAESGKISVIPNPLVLMQVNKQKAYSESFLLLCALQHLQTLRKERQLGILGQKKKLNIGLWAIDELVSPIASRIEYHFLKWVDQPEFIFALAYKITRDFVAGVDDVLQPLIDRAKLVSFSAKEAWVSAMVQTLSAFLGKRIFPDLAERYKEKEARLEVTSSWLSLIDLMVKFDKQMQSLVSTEAYLFSGEPGKPEGSTGGLSVFSLFSDRPDWLKIWSKIELKDGKMKLKAQLKHESAWLVDTKQRGGSTVDSTTRQILLYAREEDNKAPLIVDFALKLAWEMIERCKTLPGILPRIKFIRSTAINFLWYLFKVLLSRYKKTDFLATYYDDDSLLTVCGLINAARYCESKLQEWSDDINFVEMDIVENGDVKDDENGYRCFLGEEIKCLADLQINWLMDLIAGLLHQFETLIDEYVQCKELFEQEEEDATSSSTSSEAMASSISVELLEALDTLRSRLSVIDAGLNPKDFSDLWRNMADGLDRFIFGSIILSDFRFSEKGKNQFETDMRALFLIFQHFCARPEAFFPCIRDSLKLLGMNRQDIRRLQIVSASDIERTACLRSFGVLHISFHQAEKITRNKKLGSETSVLKMYAN